MDQNGEITDPPVSVTKATTPRAVKYAVPRAISPPSSPSGAVFCETCLKNQHLVAASLAQYLPDDPDSPDYAELEKKYYRFRKGLEQRYPQICSDCEPKVRQRIEQSAYTAKTDVLRRMIDRTENHRTKKEWSPLHLFDLIGSWLRVVALTLQLLWHASVLYPLLVDYIASQEDLAWMQPTLRMGLAFFGLLPATDLLINWSLIATVCGSWWNPRFVQTVRGFTKHLAGFSNWYMYQVMVISIRLACMKLFSPARFQTSRISSQVGSHLLMMTFAVLIYRLSGTAIRTDTTPLFGSNFSTPSRSQQDAGMETEDDGKKNMSEILDEIMQSQSPSMPPRSGNSRRPPIGSDPFQAGIVDGIHDRADSGPPLRSLTISENRYDVPSTTATPSQYGDEMDWSPSQSESTHRAFSVYRADQQEPQRFGQAPTEPKKGHFWYRVPPPPTTPAQRLFNPPNQPRLRKSPVTKSEISFRGAMGDMADNNSQLAPTDESRSSVAFAQPSFFPPPAQNDPRNSLSDLFTDTFSLTPRQEEQANQRSWVGNLMGFMNTTKTDRRRS